MGERYLVTSALPYANGPIHLGHLAGAYLPADIFVRYLKLKGADVIFICGTDEHGVPITIRAEKEGVSPREIVDRYHKLIKESFEGMRIDFDNFSGTARPHHYEMSQKFFLNLLENGHLSVKTEKHFYCPKCKRFLPDRYVIGKCPHCGYERARGDQCEKCGKLLVPQQLIDPKCAICGSTPVEKETKHWFFKLQDFSDKLKEWLKSKTHWRKNVREFSLGWIKEGLKERAITRDLDWGVPVPLEEAEGKVLYVWFDAPIGYISSTVEWAERIGKPDEWKKYWQEEGTKIVHFIGKDNIPFHAIIWPAMLMGQKEHYNLPWDIPANEYLTLEGEKISTSLNWAVWVNEYLEEFPPDPLRYFLSANMPETKDADFSWKAFQKRNNDELANILGNFANRVLKFIQSRFVGAVPEVVESKVSELERRVFDDVKNTLSKMLVALERYEFRKATEEMMNIARLGNKYFDEGKPWVWIKEDREKAGVVINTCVQILRVLAVAMYPFMPDSAVKLWKMLGEKDSITDERWEGLVEKRIEAGRKLPEPEVLFTKVPDEVIERQVKKLKERAGKLGIESKQVEMITIDEFKKVDLRVAEIVSAERIKKSKKLILMKIRVGDEERQLVGGLAEHFEPSELVGKKIIVVYNLQPAKLMGYESQGMLLAAEDEEGNLALLTVDGEVKTGAKVR